ncbi:MAG: hypothetical protein HRU41_41700 [Saprospiraceae bacterium]|nr:hypothetical protein [Saprospiraceae bacterium]
MIQFSYRKSILPLLFLFVSFSISAQELADAITAFEKALNTVESSKLTYRHALSFDTDKPYNLTFALSKEGKKSTEDMEYSFNLADLNPRLISWKAKGDVIEFKVQTQKKQKFVEVAKNGDPQNYSSEITFYATSSDNARELEKALEECIELATSLFTAELDISSYPDGVDWLVKNVKAVDLKKKRIDQQLSKLDKFSTVFELISIEGDKQEEWTFNIADLRPSSVRMEVTGQEVSVNVKTEKSLKYITASKEGEKGSYVSELDFAVNSIEDGRFLSDVLSKTITYSQALVKDQTLDIQSFEEAFTLAQPLIKKAIGRTGEVSQELVDKDCRTSIRKNGKENEEFIFDFSDFNEQTVSIKVSTKYLTVVANTNEKDLLIQEFKGGELNRYYYTLEIEMDHIEEAKKLEEVFQQLIPQCANSRGFSFPEDGSNEELISWLAENLPSFETSTKEYEQALEKSGDDPCSLVFTQTESTEKKSSTEVFEFNLVDIDPLDIQYAIRSKELAISVKADGNRKYIKHYKDEKTDDYVSSFKVFFEDLEIARNAKAALAIMAEGCK